MHIYCCSPKKHKLDMKNGYTTLVDSITLNQLTCACETTDFD